MTSRPGARPFNLLDAMILVAFLGLGLAVARDYPSNIYAGMGNFEWPPPPGFPQGNLSDWFILQQPRPKGWPQRAYRWLVENRHQPLRILYPSLPVLVAGTLAAVALRLRRPRPPRRRLFREPGFLACATVTAVLALRALSAALRLAGSRPLSEWGPFLRDLPARLLLWNVLLSPFPLGIMTEAGLAVGAVWGAFWLGGRWRPERFWLDRLGRALGLAWLAVVPLAVGWLWLTRWVGF